MNSVASSVWKKEEMTTCGQSDVEPHWFLSIRNPCFFLVFVLIQSDALWWTEHWHSGHTEASFSPSWLPAVFPNQSSPEVLVQDPEPAQPAPQQQLGRGAESRRSLVFSWGLCGSQWRRRSVLPWPSSLCSPWTALKRQLHAPSSPLHLLLYSSLLWGAIKKVSSHCSLSLWAPALIHPSSNFNVNHAELLSHK